MFVQCKDMDEVENILQEKEFGFVTEDFRVYDNVMFGDKFAFHDLDAETLEALMDLKMVIDMCIDGMHEMPFTQVVKDAQELDDSFKRAMEIIKAKRPEK